MTPRTMAIAYRIWAYATACEWNCTAAEIAEGIGESMGRVRAILIHQKWSKRLRDGSGEAARFALHVKGKGIGHLGVEASETARAIIPGIRRQIEAETWD